jgi:hypothetical protein
MRFHHSADFLKSTSPRRRPPARIRLSLEELEQRSLPSVSPTPIPGSINPGLDGPDIHAQLPGPADNTTGLHGGEPSTITGLAAPRRYGGVSVFSLPRLSIWAALRR